MFETKKDDFSKGDGMGATERFSKKTFDRAFAAALCSTLSGVAMASSSMLFFDGIRHGFGTASGIAVLTGIGLSALGAFGYMAFAIVAMEPVRQFRDLGRNAEEERKGKGHRG